MICFGPDVWCCAVDMALNMFSAFYFEQTTGTTTVTISSSYLKLMTPLFATNIVHSSPGIQDGCHSRKILTNDMHMLITSLMPSIPASIDIYNLVKHLRLDLI